MNVTRTLAPGSATRIFAMPGRYVPTLAPETGVGAGELLTRFEAHHIQTKSLFERTQADIKGLLEKTTGELATIGSRLSELEQKSIKRPIGSSPARWEIEGIGARFTSSDAFKSMEANGYRGVARLEVKTITSAAGSAGGALGGFVAPDRQVEPIMLPRQVLPLRALLNPTPTTSNVIHFMRQTVRNLAAASVAENPSVPKPQSDIQWQEYTAPVQTIAHWIPASKQVMMDAPVLSSLVDAELTYGLKLTEELQILLGDGTGTNLFGIMPQAAAFDPTILPIANATMIDRILQAIAQAELALLPATGIVLNPLDYYAILAIKDTQGRYIGGGPFQALADKFWELPKSLTFSMPRDHFLVGAFGVAAQIFDREQAAVLASTEDRDNFVRNMVTLLAEERIALAVKRGQAFVRGTFTQPAGS